MNDEITVWFWGWLKHHQARLPHPAWKDCAEGFFDGWIVAFEKLGVTPDEARAATLEMQAFEHPGYPEHHLPAFLATVRAHRDEARRRLEERDPSAIRSSHAAESRAAAEMAAFWEALSPEEQAERIQSVAERFPAAAKVQTWLRAFAKAELAEQMAGGAPAV